MGYRSDVAFSIQFDTADNAVAYLGEVYDTFPVLREWAGQIKRIDDTICFHERWIKWYEDYEEIQAFEAVVRSDMPKEARGYLGFYFARLGEDSGDEEYDYDGDDPGTIHIVRELSVDWED